MVGWADGRQTSAVYSQLIGNSAIGLGSVVAFPAPGPRPRTTLPYI